MSSQDAGPSSDSASAQKLKQVLRAGSILAGLLDEEIGISKAKTVTSKLSEKEAENKAAFDATLSERLSHSVAALGENAPQHEASDRVELATGELALELLVTLRTCLIEQTQEKSTKAPARPEGEEPGLSVRDIKMLGTLQTLVSNWVLSYRAKAYDHALARLRPHLYSKPAKATPAKIDDGSRFEEIEEPNEDQLRQQHSDFAEARQALAVAVDKMSHLLLSPISAENAHPTETSGHGQSELSSVLFRLGLLPYLASLLRLAFGPASEDSKTSKADQHQVLAKQRTTQLLRTLPTSSAMAALSSNIGQSQSPASLGNPTFVRTVSARLLSAQLLRPSGIRTLLMRMLSSSGTDVEPSEESSSDRGDALKKFERVATLLTIPPLNMPAEAWVDHVVSKLIEILAANSDSSSTPPPPEQLQAAGFALTRMSEKYPDLFRKAMSQRVYAAFQPEIPEAQGEAVPFVALDRSLALLSALLNFSEPSPDFYTALFGPILPQLLSLHDFLGRSNSIDAKGKIKSVDAGKRLDDLKKEVTGFLHTWTRLVDAEAGSKALIEAVRAAEHGIGSQAVESDDGNTFFWKEEAHGVAIWFGTPPQTSAGDLSSLLNDLNFSALAQKISSGQLDDSSDVPQLPANLSASLGLQPDPALVVALLKKTARKDLAQLVLPLVLDTYMANKIASKANMLSERQADSAETRSVLFLQLILQLFDAFGSDLLQGKNGTTLAFIDFSLSSPGSKRQPEAEQNVKEEEDMPFISAAPNAKTGSSLFNVATDAAPEPPKQTVEEDEDEEATEEDEELVKTALTLLLSLLEGDPELSTEKEPMLVVIESKIEALLDSHEAEIRSLGKEAKLVLTARRSAIQPPSTPSKTGTLPQDTKYKQSHDTYQEALKLLQDPILPVRAHGLVLLRKLVSDNKQEGGQAEQLDPALRPAILDIFMQAVQDEESYLYLNAVQGLGALASSGGQGAISRLVSVYVGRDDRLTSVAMTTREVEKRLRVGEALLLVIQRSGDALRPSLSTLASPLLAKLRDRSVPTVLRSSYLSILGTAVEAVPHAMATSGYAAQLAEVSMEILRIEMVPARATKRGPVKMKVQGETQTVDDDEEAERRHAEQQLLDSATTTDTKVAHLRRAAVMALIFLMRGTLDQLNEATSVGDGRPAEKLSALRMPGGSSLPRIDDAGPVIKVRPSLKKSDLLFPLDSVQRLRELTAYVAEKDTDSFVQNQALSLHTHLAKLGAQLIATGLSM